MDFTEKTVQELQERRSAIVQELETADADRLTELEAEARAIKEELETRKANEQKRAAIRDAVASGGGEKVKEFRAMPETKTKTAEEIRNSAEYIDAYARYIKTEDPRECRALLTANADAPDGSYADVPVPTYIEGRIRTAWESNSLLRYVNRTYVKGNLGIGFEVSATDAAIHEEGTPRHAEETLRIGTVTLIPYTVKKWLRVSDEVFDMVGREFLDYIYGEITAKILKAVCGRIIEQILDSPDQSNAVSVGIPTVGGKPSLGIVAKAEALLSDEAANISVVMNRATHADFIEAMAANGYMFDPLYGRNVVYDNHLASFTDALEDEVFMIVGDLSAIQANFPNGDDVKLKYDDLTEAEADLVKIVGRLPVATGVTAPGRLAVVRRTQSVA